MMLPAFGTADHATMVTHGRHQGVQSALAWLAFSHLPDALQSLSEPLYGAACELIDRIPTDSPELTTALNSLVEAKDWMVRAGIRSDYGRPGPVGRPDKVVDPPKPVQEGSISELNAQDAANPLHPVEAGRKLVGPPHAHLDGPCADACYTEALPGFTDSPRHRHADGEVRASPPGKPPVIDNRIGPNFGRPIQDRPQA